MGMPGPIELLMIGGVLVVLLGVPLAVVLVIVVVLTGRKRRDFTCQNQPDPSPGGYTRGDETIDIATDVTDPPRPTTH